MTEDMAEMETNYAEVRQVNRCKIADMEEKASEMACDTRRKNCCMKAEMENLKAEEYEYLAREREKIKNECCIKNANQCRREAEVRLNRS